MEDKKPSTAQKLGNHVITLGSCALCKNKITPFDIAFLLLDKIFCDDCRDEVENRIKEFIEEIIFEREVDEEFDKCVKEFNIKMKKRKFKEEKNVDS